MDKRNELLKRIENGLDQALRTKSSDLVRMIEQKYKHKIEIVLDEEEQNALKTFETLPKLKDWNLYFDDNFNAVLVAKNEDFYVSCTTEHEENRKRFITNLKKPKEYCSISEKDSDNQTFVLYVKDEPLKTLRFSTTPRNSEAFQLEENLNKQEQMTRDEIHIIFNEIYSESINSICGHENRYYWRLYFEEKSCSLICVGTNYKLELETGEVSIFITECKRSVAAGKFVAFCGTEKIGQKYRVFIEDKYQVGFSI